MEKVKLSTFLIIAFFQSFSVLVVGLIGYLRPVFIFTSKYEVCFPLWSLLQRSQLASSACYVQCQSKIMRSYLFRWSQRNRFCKPQTSEPNQTISVFLVKWRLLSPHVFFLPFLSQVGCEIWETKFIARIARQLEACDATRWTSTTRWFTTLLRWVLSCGHLFAFEANNQPLLNSRVISGADRCWLQELWYRGLHAKSDFVLCSKTDDHYDRKNIPWFFRGKKWILSSPKKSLLLLFF